MLPSLPQDKANHLAYGAAIFSAEDAKVVAICATVHTEEVVAAYKAAQVVPAV